MKNKKLLIGGASAASLVALGLGAFAFFTDTDTAEVEAQVGTVELSASAEIKHTQIKRDRVLYGLYYGSQVIDGIEGPQGITYPYYPESEHYAKFPASWDLDFIETIEQTRAAFETAPDNINPGDNNYQEKGYEVYPGTDHELIINYTNEGSKSIQTRIVFEVTGTAADNTPLTTEELKNIKLYYDAMNSVSGLTSIYDNVFLPPEIYSNRILLEEMQEDNASENKLIYGFDKDDVANVIDRSETKFGSVMTMPHSDAAFTSLVLSGHKSHNNREIEYGLKRYYEEDSSSQNYEEWTWTEKTEEIEAPTSASFKFDIAMNSGLDFDYYENAYVENEHMAAMERLASADIQIKVIVQGMQYRNTGDALWDTLFEQTFVLEDN